VISVISNFQGARKDYADAALDAWIECALNALELVGAVSDHLRAQLSALAHYSDESVFVRYPNMESKGLRFLGCGCHKLNLAVQDLLRDPAARLVFRDLNAENSDANKFIIDVVSIAEMAEDLKMVSEFVNSKPLRTRLGMCCPKYCVTRWTNLIDIRY
jgi:hypothetical protein